MVIYLGSLVQLCCGEGGTHCKQTSLLCMGSAHSVFATLGLLPLTACVLSWSTLLRLQVALQGNCLKRALGCMHFPGLSFSGSGSRVLHKDTDSVEPVLCPSQVRASQTTRCSESTPSPGGAVRLITSPVPAVHFPGCSVGAPSQLCHVSPLGS